MASPESTPTPIEVVRVGLDALNAHDVEALRSLMAENIVQTVVPVGVQEGREAAVAYYKEILAATPDFRIELISALEDANQAIVTWRSPGTFTGARFMGIEPTGKQLVMEGATSYTIRNGLATVITIYYDGTSFARQIGMLPRQGSLGERTMIAAFNAKTRLQKRLRRS
jgi:predicted ester cyclase